VLPNSFHIRFCGLFQVSQESGGEFPQWSMDYDELFNEHPPALISNLHLLTAVVKPVFFTG
jgi:hypothetical protein